MATITPPLPPALTRYLQDNGLDSLKYRDTLLLRTSQECRRYVRLRGEAKSASEKDLAGILNIPVEQIKRVKWLPEDAVGGPVFAVPASARIRECEWWDDGQIFGIDAASIAAVWALSPGLNDCALEICCAPGAKLCLLADLCNRVTGVDISYDRLASARTHIRRCSLSTKVEALWVADGCTWPEGNKEDLIAEGLTKYDRKKNRRAKKKALRKAETVEEGIQSDSNCPSAKKQRTAHPLFDRVLVDAECSTDGSLKHLRKYLDDHLKGVDDKCFLPDQLDFRLPWLENDKREDLQSLQLALLKNGWRHVRPGGILVYSTCSLTRFQNEDVVLEFLKSTEGLNAQPDPLPFSTVSADHLKSLSWDCSTVPCMDPSEDILRRAACRFDPFLCELTGGLFVMRLRKAVL